MFRFIWQNWWRHKERFILLLVGALIVSSGLSYLVGLSQTNKGTIVNALEKRWSASYDIVVRPSGSRSVTEDKHLLEPDYLSGLSGGISLDQYHKIQHIDGVSVAAPIAMIGYLPYQLTVRKVHFPHKGVYRLTMNFVTDTGPRTIPFIKSHYYFVEGRGLMGSPKTANYEFNGDIFGGSGVLLAGIDPKAEAKLVGLDDAVIKSKTSHYFENDPVFVTQDGSGGQYQIPILVSNTAYVDNIYHYTIERLDLPLNDHTMKKMISGRGYNGYQNFKFLDQIPAIKGTKQSYTFTSDRLHHYFIENLKEDRTGATEKHEMYHRYLLGEKTSALQLHPVASPFPKRWPFAYEPKIAHNTNFVHDTKYESFRPVKLFSKNPQQYPVIYPDYIGIYNPKKLDIAKDPLTELPMETYRPAVGKFVLDANGEPVNPPIEMKPSDDLSGLLTKPPGMLTTIKAAAKILGDKPISAIRIKVAGVDSLSDASQHKLEAVAQKIEDETGLITDITLGSSPQPALMHVPAMGDLPELGWVQQPWVKLGSSFAIFKETKIGFAGIIGSVILVAVVYVFASLLVSLFARRKEFAVLLAVGWRPRQLSKMIFWEATLLGGFVAVVAWTILGLVESVHQTGTTMLRVLLAGLLGFVIYGLGAIIPAILSTRIAPFEAMRTGEMLKTSHRFMRTRSVFSMAFNHLLGTWRRSLLSVVAIAVPTGLLAFFLFVTFRLKGIMYTTWLGQYVAIEVGPQNYVAMVVALLIAVLTTAEVMWQNVSERQPEIALLKSVGWRNRNVRFMVLLEGGYSGVAAGIIGLVIAFGIIWGIYQKVPYEHLGFLLATGIIPIVTGLIGAVLPSERAVRILPSQGVRGQYANRKKTERRFQISLGIAAAVLLAGFSTMVITTVPTAVKNYKEAHADQNVQPTGGKATSGSAEVEQKDHDKQNREQKQNNNNSLGLTLPMPILTVIKVGEAYAIGSDSKFSAKLVEVSNQADLEPPKQGMKYISIRLRYQAPKGDEVQIVYQPYYFPLYTKKGEQKMIDSKLIESDNYKRNRYVFSGGSATSVLTFEVPKNAKHLVLVSLFNYGNIAIKIK